MKLEGFPLGEALGSEVGTEVGTSDLIPGSKNSEKCRDLHWDILLVRDM